MTISPWTIYLITRLDDINTGIALLLWTASMIVILGVISYCVESSGIESLEEKQKKCKEDLGNENTKYNDKIEKAKEELKKTSKLIKRFIIGIIITGLLAIAVPSTKQAYKILLIPAVVNGGAKVIDSQTVNKSVELINQYLDKKLKETK